MIACDCVIIGVGNHWGVYSVGGLLEWRKYTEVYNCEDITILQSSVVVFLGVILGEGTGW